jgi:hypothetical protein
MFELSEIERLRAQEEEHLRIAQEAKEKRECYENAQEDALRAIEVVEEVNGKLVALGLSETSLIEWRRRVMETLGMSGFPPNSATEIAEFERVPSIEAECDTLATLLEETSTHRDRLAVELAEKEKRLNITESLYEVSTNEAVKRNHDLVDLQQELSQLKNEKAEIEAQLKTQSQTHVHANGVARRPTGEQSPAVSPADRLRQREASPLGEGNPPAVLAHATSFSQGETPKANKRGNFRSFLNAGNPRMELLPANGVAPLAIGDMVEIRPKGYICYIIGINDEKYVTREPHGEQSEWNADDLRLVSPKTEKFADDSREIAQATRDAIASYKQGWAVLREIVKERPKVLQDLAIEEPKALKLLPEMIAQFLYSNPEITEDWLPGALMEKVQARLDLNRTYALTEH